MELNPMALTSIRELKPGDRDKLIEVKVYRAWATRNPPDTTEKGYRAILLDRHGDAIQANMLAEDIHHFRPILIPGTAFRISGFHCGPTDNWQQTLENKTSLSFTTLTKLDPIPAESFPNHYFNFTSYNQLPTKLYDPRTKNKKEYPVLTDYIGCYITSGDAGDIGDPNKNQSRIRKVEIQNLNRNSIELTLWDQLADSFPKETIETLERPIIIAVSSCRVSRFQNRQLQLSSTAATYYYINPNIPELEQYKAAYRALYAEKAPLCVTRYRLNSSEQEQQKNRIPIAILLEHNPDTYKGVRFTCEGTITNLNTTRGWYYTSCCVCTSKATKIDENYECKKHGFIPAPNYRYNFRATITDGTKSAQFIFFTPKADQFISVNCAELVTSNESVQPGHFPSAIEAIVGTKHTFQFHYNPTCNPGYTEFVIDEVFGITDQVKPIEGQLSDTESHPKLLPPTTYIPTATTTQTIETFTNPIIQPQHSQGAEVLKEKQQENPPDTEKTAEKTTPATSYTGMQTRSKTDTTSNVAQKTVKRPLFTEEPSYTKRTRN